MSTLQSQRVADLLDKLFADAEKNDPPRLARVRSEIGRHNVNMPDEDRRKLMQLMRDVYIPVAPEVGRLLYLLARMRGARTIVEFGTSLGISAIHLAAAVPHAVRPVTGACMFSYLAPTAPTAGAFLCEAPSLAALRKKAPPRGNWAKETRTASRSISGCSIGCKPSRVP